MANGLLSELRRIAESSKDIPQESVNRLMLSAVAELVVKMDQHTEYEQSKTNRIDDTLDNLCESVETLTTRMEDLGGKITLLTADVVRLRSNPSIALGKFIREHPKTAFTFLVAALASGFILVTSRPFLILVLTLMGLPSDAIEQILILMQST